MRACGPLFSLLAVSAATAFVVPAPRLPSHMIPASFIVLNEIPRGFNGKVNTAALPAESRSRPNLDAAYKPCSTPEEFKLARIWEEILKKDQLGGDDGFWELEGDSLLLTQLLHLVEEHFAVSVSPAQFSKTPTIKTLAARIVELRSLQNPDPIVSIPEVARSGILFPSISQEALPLAQLRNEIRRSPTIVGATGFGLSIQDQQTEMGVGESYGKHFQASTARIFATPLQATSRLCIPCSPPLRSVYFIFGRQFHESTFGVYFANRDQRHTELLIGDFSTFRVLGVDISSRETLGDITVRVKDAISEASIFQEMPWSMLSDLIIRQSTRRKQTLSKSSQPRS